MKEENKNQDLHLLDENVKDEIRWIMRENWKEMQNNVWPK